MTPEDEALHLIQETHREERKAVLTTTECAKALGVTAEFVRGEIRDGRLKARVFMAPGRRRAKYRIEAVDFADYREQHWPKSA